MTELDYTVSDIVSNGSGFTPLVPGKYVADIVRATVEVSKKNNNNRYLNLEIKTDQGRVWDIVNLWNQNPVAVDIAKKTLDQIGHALGMTRIKDTDEILNRRIGILVETEKNGDRVRVTRYMNAKAVAETEAPLSSAPQTSSQPLQATGVSIPQAPPSTSSKDPDDDISDVGRENEKNDADWFE